MRSSSSYQASIEWKSNEQKPRVSGDPARGSRYVQTALSATRSPARRCQ